MQHSKLFRSSPNQNAGKKDLAISFILRQDGQHYPTANCESLPEHIEAACKALRAAEHEIKVVRLRGREIKVQD